MVSVASTIDPLHQNMYSPMNNEASTSNSSTAFSFASPPTLPLNINKNVAETQLKTPVPTTTAASFPTSNGTSPSQSQQPQTQPFFQRPGLRFKAAPKPDELIQEGPGRRLRKNVANVRRHIDYISNAINHIEGRLWQYSKRDRPAVQPDILYHNTVLPPSSTKDLPVDCVLTKFVRAAMNKIKCPIYSLCWTPEGKRVITGASSGEFTLWNGTAFNFETILQAHDVAIRAIKWSHNDQWMASADQDGFVKYWQPNMNNVHMFQAHKDEPIRSLRWCNVYT